MRAIGLLLAVMSPLSVYAQQEFEFESRSVSCSEASGRMGSDAYEYPYSVSTSESDRDFTVSRCDEFVVVGAVTSAGGNSSQVRWYRAHYPACSSQVGGPCKNVDFGGCRCIAPRKGRPDDWVLLKRELYVKIRGRAVVKSMSPVAPGYGADFKHASNVATTVEGRMQHKQITCAQTTTPEHWAGGNGPGVSYISAGDAIVVEGENHNVSGDGKMPSSIALSYCSVSFLINADIDPKCAKGNPSRAMTKYCDARVK